MKVAMFSTHEYEKEYFLQESKSFNHELIFLETRLTEETAKEANAIPCVCAFVNDNLDFKTLSLLTQGGTKLVALRSTGFNHVDLIACKKLGLSVVRVPDHSPHAVAEHAVSLILSLNRQIPRSYNRVRDGNFSIEGLVGFDLSKKTVGIIGTGKIGSVMARIMLGFGCDVIAHDLIHNQTLSSIGVQYVSLDKLLRTSDIISLHLPLTNKTHYIINEEALAKTKDGVMLINTGRGALIDTKELIESLKQGRIGYAGLDVYEKEEGIFFEDHSGKIIEDDMLSRLMTFPNVIITSHHAFLTKEALRNIALTTLQNIADFESEGTLINEVIPEF
ncbi:2-hydroxyacid dehydrogenase [Bacteriovorax sp. PP10]|uniref:2-hydroxyacid dehydrogenase n=1 Tax=Bacteriovorax antarcticus TaxID=3088717 RepID=A0ABU5VY97_9BACT|nr:2-hydroxyacid dehydrogenase [Bacteriovorax sp. PP10]MEA9357572.1 2-hydroxyacid dehydrogenase [Bacteriovorax sp. PP10]